MEDYNDPIREATEGLILDEAEGIKKLKVGSDERKKAVECFCAEVKSYHEDCRLGGQLLKDQEEIDLAKKRHREESYRADRKMEMEEANADASRKWYNQPIVEKLLVCGTSIGTLGLCMTINSGMTPLKSTLEKFIFFVKPRI
jgi:hypothetical protein